MIVGTGATGQLGRLVIASLLKKIPASGIVAAVRNTEKAKDIAALGVQVRHADYSQPATWDAALKGAEKVLLISSSEIGQRAKQHRAVIDGAKRAGVKLLTVRGTSQGRLPAISGSSRISRNRRPLGARVPAIGHSHSNPTVRLSTDARQRRSVVNK